MATQAASWIAKQNDFSNSESLCHSDASHQVSAQSALRFGRRCRFEEFQDGRHGSHLECWNGINLAVLNLHVSPVPPTKFQLNQTYRSGADVVSKFSSWPPRPPSWIAKLNDFSNSESLCHSDASHQVSAQFDMVLEEMLFEEFQDGHHGSHLGYRNETILAILNLYVTPMPPINFQLNPT